MNKHTRQAALNQEEIGHLAAPGATPQGLTWPLASRKLSRLRGFKPPSWLMSWLLVSPITAILTVFFALPTLLFLVVSFFDHDRVGIYPDFLLDSYRDLITNPATVRLYSSTFKFAAIVWAVTLLLGFNIAYFLV